jgi:hypothetical protein
MAVLAHPLEEDHASLAIHLPEVRDAFFARHGVDPEASSQEGLTDETLVRGPLDLGVRSFSEQQEAGVPRFATSLTWAVALCAHCLVRPLVPCSHGHCSRQAR